MSPSPGNLVVRANYLAVVVFGTFLAMFVTAFAFSATSILLTTVLYVFPGARAIRRVVSNGTVISPELVSERPVVASVVTLAGLAGHLFFVLSMSIAIDLALLPEWPEDTGGPIAFIFSLAMLSYLIALLCGELALVGDGVSDAARRASSP